MPVITNTFPQLPAAKIIVDGLFILCVNEQTRTAQLGVYEYANEHDFFIRVSKKEHGVKTKLFKDGLLVKKLDDRLGHEIETGDVTIAVSNRSQDIGYYQHASVTEDILATDPGKNLNSTIEFPDLGYTTDFRWIIDMENTRFHDKKLKVTPGVIKRKVNILNGILYTESWVPRKITPAYIKATDLAGHSTTTRHLFVANQVAFAINQLSDDETIDIQYTQNGKPETLSLPKVDKGIYYEILVSNNCPASVAEKKLRQSDFQHYYNVVDVPIVERYELGRADGAGDDRIPCDLIYLGQTPELP